MIGELGHFALILLFVCAGLQAAVGLWGAARADRGVMRLADGLALSQLLMAALSFGALMWGYAVSDFSILNVAENSHTLKPMLYKISGVWGNHEGSILLWILILSLSGGAVALFGHSLPAALRSRVLGVLALVALGFSAFALFTSNPFIRLDPAPLNGNGLNPLLQDPGLAFHPPLLYLGYVGLSVPFAFAIAALLEGRVDAAWARWVRPWTLTAWSFLTAGIALGSWWAYYELGWGGFWFWDPVENASFMPWLAATALLHSAIVVERRDALKSWTVLLALIAFSLSLLGTFIVRSGVLNSVHAFANDPERGVFILAFLALVVGGSLVLYGLRAPMLRHGGTFAPISRESAMLFNNVLLAAASGTVLVGTLFPLMADAAGYKVSVAAPYFNAVFVPLMTPLVIVMAAGPLIPWRQADLMAVLGRLKGAAVATALIVGVAALLWDLAGAGGVLGLALSVWLMGGTLKALAIKAGWGRTPVTRIPGRIVRLPRGEWGTALAHGGLAVMILGITGASLWEREASDILKPGESLELAPYTFTLDRVERVAGPNYTARRGTIVVREDGGEVATLTPEMRRYPSPPMDTTEAAIRPTGLSHGLADLYVVIGEAPGSDGWGVRASFKPLIACLWLGAGLMVLGGGLSVADRRLWRGTQDQMGRSVRAGEPLAEAASNSQPAE